MGKINFGKVDDKKLVYTSIPYDEGWKVYVDGKEVETKALANSFLTFNIDKGTHKIKFKYHIPYFKEGIILTIFGISVLIIDKLYGKKIKEKLVQSIKKKPKKEKKKKKKQTK